MDKREHTKEKILKAAEKHFADFGFEGARMDKIAIDARVNKASIYYNIGNKEALYSQVLNKAFDRRFSSIKDVIKADLPAEKKLETYARYLAKGLEENPVISKIMMREQISQGEHMPASFISNIVKLLDCLSMILEQGYKENVFQKVDTVTIHFMILGTLLFQMTSSIIRRNKEGFPQKYKPDHGVLPGSAQDYVVEYILKAVKKEK